MKGKITTNENDEVVRVTWGIYCKQHAYMGGLKQFCFTNLLMIGFIVSKVYCDYFVGTWAYSTD
jgi:hypothetical protein